MVKYTSKEALILRLWNNYKSANTRYNMLVNDVNAFDADLADYDTSLDALDFQIAFLTTPTDLPSCIVAFPAINNCITAIYDVFANSSLRTALTDLDYSLYDIQQILLKLIGKNNNYATDYDITLYLNHYTMDNIDDVMREFARNDFNAAEITTLMIDKMKWYCGEIQYNEQKAVYPETYIPVKFYNTLED